MLGDEQLVKPESLRIFFFSDWRIQPHYLIESMFEKSGPIAVDPQFIPVEWPHIIGIK